jgi:hypothetical protein
MTRTSTSTNGKGKGTVNHRQFLLAHRGASVPTDDCRGEMVEEPLEGDGLPEVIVSDRGPQPYRTTREIRHWRCALCGCLVTLERITVFAEHTRIRDIRMPRRRCVKP